MTLRRGIQLSRDFRTSSSNVTDESGMLLIISHFTFWKCPKAGILLMHFGLARRRSLVSGNPVGYNLRSCRYGNVQDEAPRLESDPTRRGYEPEVCVDTGAAFSWVSRSKLEAMGVKPLRQTQFRTIEGHIVERPFAAVFVGFDRFMSSDMVVMAEETDSEVMGAHSIEGLGLAADPVQHRLVPTVMLAHSAGTFRASKMAKTGGSGFESVKVSGLAAEEQGY